jgi:hypothetical protein
MAAPSWTQTIDTLYTSTWEYRKKEAIEQAYLKTPFIFWLRQKGHVENISGYKRIEVPVEYGSNETVRWITKGQTVPIQDSELITMAYEDWKYVAVSIVRWFEDEQKNRGKAQMINMVERNVNAAERTLWEEMERVMFADGSGLNEPNGLQNIISATPTLGTLHGLSRVTYDWWRNQQKTSTGAAAVYLVSDMRTVLNNIIKYSRAELADIVLVTTQTVFELYEDVCLEMKILQNTMMADAGFDSIVFKGKTMLWCPSAPSGNMYFINPKYVKLITDESFFMEMTDWKQIPDQPFDKVAQIICTMNMINQRPIANSVLTGIAA